MKTITFRDELAHGVYHSMIEGMYEMAIDDRDTTLAGKYEALLQTTGGSEVCIYPATFPLMDYLFETAEIVFLNCADNNDRFYSPEERDEEESEPDCYLYDGDVVLSIVDEPKVEAEHGFGDYTPPG